MPDNVSGLRNMDVHYRLELQFNMQCMLNANYVVYKSAKHVCEH